MTHPTDEVDPARRDHVLLCRASSPDPEQLREFLETSGAEPACRPVARRTEQGYETTAVLTGAQLEAARSSRSAREVAVDVLEDLTDQALARRNEVGAGNRFEVRGAIPRGLGRKE